MGGKPRISDRQKIRILNRDMLELHKRLEKGGELLDRTCIERDGLRRRVDGLENRLVEVAGMHRNRYRGTPRELLDDVSKAADSDRGRLEFLKNDAYNVSKYDHWFAGFIYGAEVAEEAIKALESSDSS